MVEHGSHIPVADTFASKQASDPRAASGAQRLKDTRANRALFPDETDQSTFLADELTSRAHYHDPWTVVLHGDVRDELRRLKKAGVVVDTIVTSPPFYGQRDYGVEGQIGLEAHPGRYIERLVEVFALCREVLRDTGSLWVNLGDTYWSGKGQHRSDEVKQSARRFGARPQDHRGDGRWTRPKQLLLLPHRFAIAMQEDGWLVRGDNVWGKPNPIPDQVRDRCTRSHEHVFHFTTQRWYYFDKPAVSVPAGSGRQVPPPDTWLVPPARGDGRHRASFSAELVRIPILGSCPPRGIVLDPFAGSGTSLVFARRHGLRSIGIELVEGYCAATAEAVGAVEAPDRYWPRGGDRP